MVDAKVISESDVLEINSNLFRLAQIIEKRICIFDTESGDLYLKTFKFSFRKSQDPYKIYMAIKCDDKSSEKEIDIFELAEAINSARLNGEYPPNSYKFRNIIFDLVDMFMKENIPNGITVNDFIRHSNVLLYNKDNILAAVKETFEDETEFINVSIIGNDILMISGEYVFLDLYGYKKKKFDDSMTTASDFKFDSIFTRKDLDNDFSFVIYNQDKDIMVLIEASNQDDLAALKIINKKVVDDYKNSRTIIKNNYNNPEEIINSIIDNRNISTDMNFLFSIE